MNICLTQVVLSLTEHDAFKIEELLRERSETDRPEWRGYWLCLAYKVKQARIAYYNRRLEMTVMG